MKKLSVLLLATVFVFGLVVQTNAQVTDGVDAGDQVITFYDIAPGITVGGYYWDEYGVSFPDNLYGEGPLASFMFRSPEPASNFNVFTFNDGKDGEPVIVTFNSPATHVGFIGFSPGGGITVTPFRDQVAGAPVYVVTPSGTELTFISIEDSLGIDMVQIEGDGCYGGKCFIFWIDDFTFGGTPDTGPTEIPVTTVKMNVKPPNCLGASINMKSQGVTPVVIAGSEDFDVTTIDSSSVRLNGVAPVRTSIEDVPLCGSPEPDGFLDLALKFDTQELVQAMGAFLQEGETLENDDMVALELSGNLLEEWGGAPIEGLDTVTVIDKVKNKKCEDNKGKNKKHKKHNHKNKKVRNGHGWTR